MSLSSLREVRCSSYCFAKPELLCVPGITTSSAIQRRMSKEQNWRTGLLTTLSKSAIPFLSGLDKRVARNPLNMLPPKISSVYAGYRAFKPNSDQDLKLGLFRQ